ncbi:MAG: addiction module toxin, HicA family [Chloroflexi bacterium]|nr:addiction module toxin, HicA family [Chloroflexota bacterium]
MRHREGSRHTIFLNSENGHLAAVPRHLEIEIILARKICRQLDISIPKTKA